MEARRASHARAGAARRHRFGRRTRGSRGAALVEFALIAPILFLVLFGIIEFGMALNDYQSIRHGVREGARQTVVRQYPESERRTDCTTDATAPDEVKWAICLTKDRIGLGDDVLVRMVFEHETAASLEEAPADGDPVDPEQYVRVKVCAQRNVEPVTGALPMIDGITLESSIEMRMERSLQSTITGEFGDGADEDWPGCVEA